MAKVQVIGIVFKPTDGVCFCFRKRWQPLQVRTSSSASASADGQKKPYRMAFAVMDLDDAWWPHSSLWMLSSSRRPSTGSTQRW